MRLQGSKVRCVGRQQYVAYLQNLKQCGKDNVEGEVEEEQRDGAARGAGSGAVLQQEHRQIRRAGIILHAPIPPEAAQPQQGYHEELDEDAHRHIAFRGGVFGERLIREDGGYEQHRQDRYQGENAENQKAVLDVGKAFFPKGNQEEERDKRGHAQPQIAHGVHRVPVESVGVIKDCGKQLPVGNNEHDEATEDDFQYAQKLSPPAVHEGRGGIALHRDVGSITPP